MPQPRRAQPRAKCPQSAAHSLPRCPLPTGSSAPALKGAPWAGAERQHPGMQNGGQGADEATRLGARPGKAGEQTAAKRPPCPPPRGANQASPRGYAALAPPPPAKLTQGRPTRPRRAPGAAQQPRPNAYTQVRVRVRREEGGLGRGQRATPPGQGGGEPRRGPLSPLPPAPPSGLRATGAPALHPPRGRRGRPPTPRKGRGARGGTQLSPHAARPRAPHRLVPRGP